MFAYASIQEGLGTAWLEAMSCGLPVVLTEINGITDAWARHEDNALVCEADDLYGFAGRLRDVRRGGRAIAEMKGRARETAVANVSLPVIGRRYMDLYGSLLR